MVSAHICWSNRSQLPPGVSLRKSVRMRGDLALAVLVVLSLGLSNAVDLTPRLLVGVKHDIKKHYDVWGVGVTGARDVSTRSLIKYIQTLIREPVTSQHSINKQILYI